MDKYLEALIGSGMSRHKALGIYKTLKKELEKRNIKEQKKDIIEIKNTYRNDIEE